MIPDLTPAEIARFYSKLRLGDCGLTWTGPVNNKGYGRFEYYREGKRRRVLAHRLSYKLWTGITPASPVTRHACDIRLCCTPDCLVPGTHLENMRDAVERGRLVHSRKREAAAQRLSTGEKTCVRCHETKSLLTAFPPRRKALDGRTGECLACGAARKRADRLALRNAAKPVIT